MYPSSCSCPKILTTHPVTWKIGLGWLGNQTYIYREAGRSRSTWNQHPVSFTPRFWNLASATCHAPGRFDDGFFNKNPWRIHGKGTSMFFKTNNLAHLAQMYGKCREILPYGCFFMENVGTYTINWAYYTGMISICFNQWLLEGLGEWLKQRWDGQSQPTHL